MRENSFSPKFIEEMSSDNKITCSYSKKTYFQSAKSFEEMKISTIYLKRCSRSRELLIYALFVTVITIMADKMCLCEVQNTTDSIIVNKYNSSNSNNNSSTVEILNKDNKPKNIMENITGQATEKKRKSKENIDSFDILMKPSKFDEHVDEDQYVDNPLLLLNLTNNNNFTLSITTIRNNNDDKTIKFFNESDSDTSLDFIIELKNPNKYNNYKKTNNNNSSNENNNLQNHIKLMDVDSKTNDSVHSAVVRKRDSFFNHNNKSVNNEQIIFPPNENLTISKYSLQMIGLSKMKPNNDHSIIANRYNNKDDHRILSSAPYLNYSVIIKAQPKVNSLFASRTAFSPSSWYVKYGIDGINDQSKSALPSLLKHDIRYGYNHNNNNWGKRVRKKHHRIRRSLDDIFSLPLDDNIVYHRRRRYYIRRNRNDRMDTWGDSLPSQQNTDNTNNNNIHYRRFIRFPPPIATDTSFRPSRPFILPPPASNDWSSSSISQYPPGYHQSLPPVPSMGPRSPRLVFRDPVEPGTLQAPFSSNGLQDLNIPEDNRDDWPDTTDVEGKDNPLCPSGSCEFFLTCWMTSGLIERACGGGFLYACCLRSTGKAAADRDANFVSSNDIQLPTNFGPVINDPRCGVSVAKQQTAQRRIVGGDEAGFGNFPWQAYIRIGSSRCGGTLVNRYHVVTAGHCVARATARQVQVTLGDYVINSAVEPLPAYTFGVKKINVHPYFKFTPQADRFDVAVLKLDRPVQYMPHISPICLPEKDEDFLGQYGWAAGWGALQAGSRLRPKTLQAVDVPIIDNRQCERWHKSNGINVVIYEEMMCAGYRGGSKDSCQGDSGGPLMFEKTGRWYLIGIVSAGYSCAQRGQPGIYHRVAHTVDWISYIINS